MISTKTLLKITVRLKQEIVFSLTIPPQKKFALQIERTLTVHPTLLSYNFSIKRKVVEHRLAFYSPCGSYKVVYYFNMPLFFGFVNNYHYNGVF